MAPNCGCSKRATRAPETASSNRKSGQQQEKRAQTPPRGAHRHPLDAANLISLLTFGWMLPFFWKAWRRGLKLADAPSVPSDAESCHKIGARLVACWARELAALDATSSAAEPQKAQVRPPPPPPPANEQREPRTNKPSLVRALVRAQAGGLLLGLLLTLISECLCKTLSAYSVGQVLKLMSAREASSTTAGQEGAHWSFSEPLCMWTTLLVLACFSHVLIAHFYGFHMMRLGLRAKTGCSYLIYTKALRLGQQESIQKTMGRVINLISNDLEKLVMVSVLAPFLLVGPLQTLISIYLLWPSLGYSCLGSVLAICTLTPIQIYLNFKYGHLRKTISAYADERVRKVNEIIMALKLIKLYGWEYSLRDALMEVRKRETDLIKRESLIKGISNAFICVSTKLVLFVTIITHCLVLGQTLNTHTLFVSMAMLNNLHITMNMIVPRATALAVEAWIGCHRVQEFLLTPEYKRARLGQADRSTRALPPAAAAAVVQGHNTNSMGRVEYVNVSASWLGSSRKTLDDISFKCEAPELIVLCGQVASGKSSILLSLIGELPVESGSDTVTGSSAYCSQKAWTFEGSIRDNIVFGRPFDEKRYEQVVDNCALRSDLQLLSSGDLTYIQENTLSGGQKARVNLARCLYGDHDIYLLDDPLSALDSRVAKQIFEEGIRGFLRGKLVIMSSHQIELIKQSDKLLLIDQGKQLAFCNFDELCDKMYSNDEFRRGQSAETLSWLRSLTVGSGMPNESGQIIIGNSGGGVKKDNCFSDLANYGTSTGVEGVEKHSEALEEDENKTTNRTANFSKNLEKNNAPQSCAGDIGSELITGSDRSLEVPGAAPCPSGTTEGHAPYGTSRLAVNEDKTLIIVADQEQENSALPSRHGCHSAEVPPRDGSRRRRCAPQVSANRNRNDDDDDDEERGEARGVSAGNGQNAGSPSVNKVNLISDGSQSTNYRTGLAAARLADGGCSCGGKAPPPPPPKSCELGALSHGVGQQSAKQSTQQQQQDGRPEGEDAASEGSPGLRIWFQYYTKTSVFTFLVVMLTFLITQALVSSVDIYLTVWSNLEQNRNLIKEITAANHKQVDNLEHLINASYHISAKNNNNSKRIPYDVPNIIGLLSEAISEHAHLLPLSVVKFKDHLMERLGEEEEEEAEQGNRSPLSAASLFYSQSMPTLAPPPLPPLLGNNGSAPLVDFADNNLLLYGSAANYTTINRATAPSSSNAQPGAQSASSNVGKPPITPSTGVPEDAFSLRSAHQLPPEADDSLSAPDNIAPVYRPLYLLLNHFDREQHATVYAILLIVLFFFSLTTSTLFLRMLNNSTIALFKNLIDSALFSKIAFFDKNPVGRFLNRATYDIGVMDALIPLTALGAYEAILMTMGSLIVVASVDLVLSLPSLAVLSIVMMFHSVHIVAIKEIKRLEGISRSPIISHISSSLEGVQTIRSNKAEDRFSEAFKQHENFHNSIYLLYIGANRFLAVFLDSINCSYVGIIAVWAVVSGMDGASAGLAITSALLLSGVTQNGIMKWTDAESAMTSVERVIEYCNLPQEDYQHQQVAGGGHKSKRHHLDSTGKQQQQQQQQPSGDLNLTNRWLTKGRVEYECVDLYYNKNGKPVLKNISFKLEPGEKVGIVGRTGAGKSSIISTLFRLYDYNGRILIDGHDIKEINLIELRKSIGIIPQSPVLLSDSIRRNLDPTNVYDDFSMWNALEKAHLRATVNALPGKLDCVIGDGGFSSGQKQLICLARVLLRKCKVIVMDEATASVDPTTDAIIQSTIRHEFKHSTVITIAHRLETIVDYNRIIVLDAGRIVDFDTPEQLAIKSNSYISDQLRKHMKK